MQTEAPAQAIRSATVRPLLEAALVAMTEVPPNALSAPLMMRSRHRCRTGMMSAAVQASGRENGVFLPASLRKADNSLRPLRFNPAYDVALA